MSHLKQQIPDRLSLERVVEAVFAKGVVDFVTNTKKRRLAVIINRRYFVLSIFAFIFTALALYLAYNYLSGNLFNLVMMYLLALVMATIVFYERFHRELRILAKEINLALVPTITTCFNRLALYTQDGSQSEVIEALLRESQLVADEVSHLVSEDAYSFFDPYQITVRELQFTKNEQTGKLSPATALFHGIFVEVELPKILVGITYISTESHKNESTHVEFWSNLLLSHEIKEVLLDWNQFENDLHIATNNPEEASSILTKNFIINLHDWWLENKENVRIVFKGNKMFMLFPEIRIKIGVGTTSAKPDELKKHALTVLKPLWHILTLVDDVKL